MRNEVSLRLERRWSLPERNSTKLFDVMSLRLLDDGRQPKSCATPNGSWPRLQLLLALGARRDRARRGPPVMRPPHALWGREARHVRGTACARLRSPPPPNRWEGHHEARQGPIG